jgi:eukaryotic-like serine/threonine-protein kinase
MHPGSPVLIGSYRYERLLGTGSFATVWLGYDESLGARVAIKVLADNWSHDLRIRERFRDEGRLLWRLDHDRVVRVHAVGDLPDGRRYLVMAWADGGSLLIGSRSGT